MIIKKEIELRKRTCMPGVGYLDDIMPSLTKNYPASSEKIATHIMDCVNGCNGKYVSHYIKEVEEYGVGLPDGEWCGSKVPQGYKTMTLYVLMEV